MKTWICHRATETPSFIQPERSLELSGVFFEKIIAFHTPSFFSTVI